MKKLNCRTVSPFILACLGLLGSNLTAAPLGTAFTWQGRLTQGTNGANGLYDFRFSLWDAPGNGANLIGATQTVDSVSLSNGLLTTSLDFGAGAFAGTARWLEVGVRTNGGATFTFLSPRQSITPAPYAIAASNVLGTLSASQLTGTLPAGLLSGTYGNAVSLHNPSNIFVGDGSALTGVNAATLGGYSVCTLPCYWNLNGNAGTTAGPNFVGTTDNQPLELKVRAQRAFRLEPTTNSPNVIGGYSGNSAVLNSYGVTIGGGGTLGAANTVDIVTNFSSGFLNYSPFATIAGGAANLIRSPYSSIGGGLSNAIDHVSLLGKDHDTISGGVVNQIIDGHASTVGGGEGNVVNGSGNGADWCTIGGGATNRIDGFFDLVWGGTIGGGRGNLIRGYDVSTIGGGFANLISQCSGATISGGEANVIVVAYLSTIGGGIGNDIEGLMSYATIGGGSSNRVGFAASGDYGTIPGGRDNVANSYGFAAGRRAKALNDGAFVWADSTDADFQSTADKQFLIRAAAGVGINTNHPTAALHVAGQPGIDGIRFPNGSLQTTAPTAAASSGLGNDPTTIVAFLAPTVTVTVQSTIQSIMVTSHKAFGSTSAGGAQNLNIYIGHRVAGSGAVPTVDGAGVFGNRVATNTRVTMGLSWVITGLSPGTYEVGLAGSSSDAANWNSNEYGYTTAVIY